VSLGFESLPLRHFFLKRKSLHPKGRDFRNYRREIRIPKRILFGITVEFDGFSRLFKITGRKTGLRLQCCQGGRRNPYLSVVFSISLKPSTRKGDGFRQFRKETRIPAKLRLSWNLYETRTLKRILFSVLKRTLWTSKTPGQKH